MNVINYECEILKHEVELGCPESAIEKECIEHPELGKILRKEAENHTHGQEHLFLLDTKIHYTPVRDTFPNQPRIRWFENEGGYLVV